jgi:hypothetical protein
MASSSAFKFCYSKLLFQTMVFFSSQCLSKQVQGPLLLLMGLLEVQGWSSVLDARRRTTSTAGVAKASDSISAISDASRLQGHPDSDQLRFKVPHRSPLSLPHLFRHYDDISFDSWLRCADPQEFWTSIGYSLEDLPADLREAHVHEQIAPHIRFLVQVW